jgi:hypothetical protein
MVGTWHIFRTLSRVSPIAVQFYLSPQLILWTFKDFDSTGHVYGHYWAQCMGLPVLERTHGQIGAVLAVCTWYHTPSHMCLSALYRKWTIWNNFWNVNLINWWSQNRNLETLKQLWYILNVSASYPCLTLLQKLGEAKRKFDTLLREWKPSKSNRSHMGMEAAMVRWLTDVFWVNLIWDFSMLPLSNRNTLFLQLTQKHLFLPTSWLLPRLYSATISSTVIILGLAKRSPSCFYGHIQDMPATRVVYQCVVSGLREQALSSE